MNNKVFHLMKKEEKRELSDALNIYEDFFS
jgi:hypothetical protein